MSTVRCHEQDSSYEDDRGPGRTYQNERSLQRLPRGHFGAGISGSGRVDVGNGFQTLGYLGIRRDKVNQPPRGHHHVIRQPYVSCEKGTEKL